MRRLKYYATGVWVDKHLAEWVTIIMVMLHLGLALAVFIGGATRLSTPAYNPLIDFSSGEVWIWGVWIGVSAILMSVPFRKLNILGLWLGMVWHIIWMVCFIIAILSFETADATLVPVYGALAMFCAALLTARVIDKTEG